jgi:hypothetical protein
LLLPKWRWWLIIGCYFWMDVIFHIWLDVIVYNERVVHCLVEVDIAQCPSSCIICIIARLACHMQNVKAPTPHKDSSWVGWGTTSVLMSPNAWLCHNDNQPFFKTILCHAREVLNLVHILLISCIFHISTQDI